MARYSKEHKEQTRRSILSAATAAFRGRGILGTRVDEVMRLAGLTHGGFYAHFDSKDELVAEACVAGVRDAHDKLFAVATRTSPEERIRALLDIYLTTERRDAAGCTLATLGCEIARQPAAVRRRFTRALIQSVEQLAPTMPADDAERQLDQTLALLSAMVGAMMLARAVSDRKLSDRILDVGRRAFGGAVERLSA